METEIVSSRQKTILLLALSLGFVGIAIFLPGPPDRGLLWAGVFFSACSAVFLVLLVRPQKLLLDEEGFMLTGGLIRSPKKIAWQDVGGFFVVPIRRGTTMIGFNYVADAINKPSGTAFSRHLAGCDVAISGVWPGTKTALVIQLNEFRQQAIKVSRP